MSTTTTNFNLIKPEKTDPADITATNQNWDVVDETLTKLNDRKLPSKKIYSVRFGPHRSDGSVRFTSAEALSGELNLLRFAPYICDESIKDAEIRGNITRAYGISTNVRTVYFDNTNIKSIDDKVFFICFPRQPDDIDDITEFYPDVVICLDYVTTTYETMRTVMDIFYDGLSGEVNFEPGVYLAESAGKHDTYADDYWVEEMTINIPFHSYETGNVVTLEDIGYELPTPKEIGAAPAYTYGTEDLVAGESELETGKLYFVYE